MVANSADPQNEQVFNCICTKDSYPASNKVSLGEGPVPNTSSAAGTPRSKSPASCNATPKAGDQSNFCKINKSVPMTFGPSSVFAGKRESKGGRQESLTRTTSSPNMFSMLSQNPLSLLPNLVDHLVRKQAMILEHPGYLLSAGSPTSTKHTNRA